jgi:putative DNA primase/helicase
MLGGIQPARLRGYLSDALRDGPANDGLFQRFQVLVYPDVTTWRYVDRSPNILAARDASLVYRRLTKLDVDFPRILHFDPEAQQLFVVWITELEAKLRNPGIHPALVSHLAKYRSLMPSLAGLFELADGDANIITLKHAQQAACWCTYLESHALRIYSMLISPERQAAAELGRRIRNGWKRLEMFFSVRDVYRNEWTGLTTPDSVRRVLPILEDADWIRSIEPEQRTTGGRLSEVYEINPLLWRMK